jgi:SSS family solute:Na+ symporter
MSDLDWLIVTLYLSGMLALAAWLGRRQRSGTDYFLAGRGMSSGSLAASTLATQCSTNSLLGAPAFVGFTLGGGMVWLQYELAVPLAMAALIVLIVPSRQMGVISIYEILEQRLGRESRIMASGCFLLFRAVATGVTIYGVTLILAELLGVDYALAVLLLMGVTLLYDLLGGMRAVVISDLLQLVLLSITVLFSLMLLGDATDWSFFAVTERTGSYSQRLGFRWRGLWVLANVDWWLLSLRGLLRLRSKSNPEGFIGKIRRWVSASPIAERTAAFSAGSQLLFSGFGSGGLCCAKRGFHYLTAAHWGWRT